MRRGLLTAILAAGCVVAFGPHAVAQFNIPVPGLGSGGSTQSTTVKSSKSNTSDRMGGGGGKGSAAKTTTVKSSKSNTSDRMGGGGGKGTAGRATTVKSSKSNTSD